MYTINQLINRQLYRGLINSSCSNYYILFCLQIIQTAQDRHIYVWETRSGELKHKLEGHTDVIVSAHVCLSRLAVVTLTSIVRVASRQ